VASVARPRAEVRRGDIGGIASKRQKAMRQGIRWGLIVRSVLGRSKWWGGKRGWRKQRCCNQPPYLKEELHMQFLLNFVCAIHTASINRWYDTLFYYSLWYVLFHPSHVRGLGLGLAF